jgi:hypothetical protein
MKNSVSMDERRLDEENEDECESREGGGWKENRKKWSKKRERERDRES